MKLGQTGSIFQDDVFEYNNHLPEDAQVIWFAEWIRQKQREFNINSSHAADNADFITKLADLFKESYEVGLFIF